MADVKALIDWVVDASLNLWNCLKTNAGIYFYVWLAVIFVFPNFKRLLRALRGSG